MSTAVKGDYIGLLGPECGGHGNRPDQRMVGLDMDKICRNGADRRRETPGDTEISPARPRSNAYHRHTFDNVARRKLMA